MGKSEVVVQWIKTLIIESMNKGTLSVPPPILTRVFQELDVSMSRYHTAAMFSEVPFPFPYAATLDLSLCLHTLITPLMLLNLTGASSFSVASVFLLVFFLWSMHLVASELENPFDGDKNDMELEALQSELNEKLKVMCLMQPEEVPHLGVTAVIAAKRLSSAKKIRTRRRTMAMSTRKTIRRSLLSVDDDETPSSLDWLPSKQYADFSAEELCRRLSGAGPDWDSASSASASRERLGREFALGETDETVLMTPMSSPEPSVVGMSVL